MMIGKELKRARIHSQLSQEELAHRANMDRSHISDLECEKKSPTVDSLMRLCDAMQTSASQLIARVERARHKKPISRTSQVNKSTDEKT